MWDKGLGAVSGQSEFVGEMGKDRIIRAPETGFLTRQRGWRRERERFCHMTDFEKTARRDYQ